MRIDRWKSCQHNIRRISFLRLHTKETANEYIVEGHSSKRAVSSQTRAPGILVSGRNSFSFLSLFSRKNLFVPVTGSVDWLGIAKFNCGQLWRNAERWQRPSCCLVKNGWTELANCEPPTHWPVERCTLFHPKDWAVNWPSGWSSGTGHGPRPVLSSCLRVQDPRCQWIHRLFNRPWVDVCVATATLLFLSDRKFESKSTTWQHNLSFSLGVSLWKSNKLN